MFTSSHNGGCMPCYSTEQERNEVEMFRNVERQAAYELRQAGHEQPILFRVK